MAARIADHSRDEYQPVDDGSGDDLTCADTASEHVKPADYNDREADHAHEPFLMSSKRGVHEKSLGGAWPNDKQEADRQVDETVYRGAFRRGRQFRRFFQESLDD